MVEEWWGSERKHPTMSPDNRVDGSAKYWVNEEWQKNKKQTTTTTKTALGVKLMSSELDVLILRWSYISKRRCQVLIGHMSLKLKKVIELEIHF